jgi:hypothetical protein
MLRYIAAILIASLVSPTAAGAMDRTRLGYGRLITNDFLGDLQDRERTGSVASSRVWGPQWTGDVPVNFGELLELRLGMEVLAPDDLVRPKPGSRPWAGALSAGVHTHFKQRSFEYSVGASVFATGPQTGLGMLQRKFHKLIGDEPPSYRTLSRQIEDGFYPTVLVEAGRSFDVGAASIRPFVSGQAGIETFVRTGVDITLGTIGNGELMIRDSASGHRYRTIQNPRNQGFSFVMGGDIAYVSDSVFLPEDRGLDLTDHRDRVRLGVHWQGEGASAFYGVTWLGKEYETQPDDQIVGSLRINLSF